MNHEPRCTITSPIYRDCAETINKTCFDIYVKESYTPVVHGVYLDHPELPPVNAPMDCEIDNICYARLPLKNIIDMLATGQEFRWKYGSDIAKAEGILKTYLGQFEGINLDIHPEAKAFYEKVKLAHDKFHARHVEQVKRTAPKKRLSIAERIRALGVMAV